MKPPKDNPFKGAPCLSEWHRKWRQMKEHRGSSMWDYHIASDPSPDTRRSLATTLCQDRCPAAAFAACKALHKEFEEQDGHRPSGIWAGEIYSDKVPVPPKPDEDEPLWTRREVEDMAA
ncbi:MULTISPECIES: hypothetical protein [Nocardia]|uniref:hypothetical protein n=1 Tax=Nocardia TaxID=1817 RepID=UPI001300198F|nr:MULTISPECIES: hypothetical protein [Nocardia]